MLLTLVLAPLTAGLILGAGRDSAPQHQSPRPPKPGSMVEATIVFSAVILLLGAWGVTQVVVALGGAGHLLAAVDLTAAEHARRGFFQLVAVVAILLMVVVAVDRTVARRTVDDRRRFLALTTVLGLETLGLALASHRRLTLYIDGFGHTMLRTAVVWFLAWLVVAMAVVIVVMNRPGGRWFRVGPALFVLGGVWVLAFGASNPEATVAAANLELDGVPAVELDRGYLVGDLGADAVPAIVDRLASQDRSTADWLTGRLCRQADRYRIDRPADWNRANAEARAAIESLDCDRLSPQD